MFEFPAAGLLIGSIRRAILVATDIDLVLADEFLVAWDSVALLVTLSAHQYVSTRPANTICSVEAGLPLAALELVGSVGSALCLRARTAGQQ
jgi:hypothetical protein